MKDLIVTTPKSQMAVAAQEAADCLAGNGGYYFRSFPRRPTMAGAGSRIFYVEDGYIRGFATVTSVHEGAMTCGTTGRLYGRGFHFIMPANTWHWIKPKPLRGFQGWRYYLDGHLAEIVGDWRDPKPQL